jgi:2-keto-4-pentenoate hydratase/2-oxohepta-3-ene-1,7-dioic acid hydratase in catechol pathway
MELRPSKIVCVGKNYRDHAREMGGEVPPEPLLFFKPPSALIPSGAPIVLPALSTHVEHEAEIGVVVGRRLRRAAEDEVMEGVAGFVCLNDVTARDWQRRESQWARAKGFDTFCPAGPRIAGGLDWRSLEVFGRVNGALRQHGRSRDMAFGIPFLLSHISGVMTLEPGDLIATGTPAGVGRLVAGDVVEVEIPGVGVLRNPVVAEADD